jgi:hypothetical protein
MAFYKTNSPDGVLQNELPGWAGWLAPTRGQITNLPHILRRHFGRGGNVGQYSIVKDLSAGALCLESTILRGGNCAAVTAAGAAEWS